MLREYYLYQLINVLSVEKDSTLYRCNKCLNEYTKEFESCPMCNGALVFFEKPLDPVDTRQKEEQERIAELKSKSTLIMKEEIERITKEVQSGQSVFLNQSFYMSVDSEMDAADRRVQINPFDDSRVKWAGLHGWKIVGVVPRTSGSARQNYEGFGKAWAGGIGGSVIGSYVLMEYELNKANLESSMDILKESIKLAYGLL